VVPEATTAGSLINVPPAPSLESEKLKVMYVPSSVKLAVCPAVSVTVNVPLVPVFAFVDTIASHAPFNYAFDRNARMPHMPFFRRSAHLYALVEVRVMVTTVSASLPR
jgi:hypothetical protein